jgi:hypothetical protein
MIPGYFANERIFPGKMRRGEFIHLQAEAPARDGENPLLALRAEEKFSHLPPDWL